MPTSKWPISFNKPIIIAGPCSAESENQIFETAKELKKIKQVQLFRAGIWKPRTRPGCFEGVGVAGLPWLQRVKNELKIPVTTEVANANHVEECLKHDIDVLWIGARTTVSPFAVQEIAEALKGVDIPIMVKNPINADLALWLGALERFEKVGITKIAALHRGFHTYEKSHYRNPPWWRIPIELKRRFPDMPLICDPSHISGNRELIPRVSQKALDLDFHGLMIEVHPDPKNALSDNAQQLTPKALAQLLNDLNLKDSISPNDSFDQTLNGLRAKIDILDQEILVQLKLRLEIVKEIGSLKSKNQVTALQVQRFKELMDKRERQAFDLGLSSEFARELYQLIHNESVKVQTEQAKSDSNNASENQSKNTLN